MKIRKMHRARFLPALICFYIILAGFKPLLAQTRIMPIGNSITWGKENGGPPIGTNEGYRKILNQYLQAEYAATLDPNFNATFVGDYGSTAPGYFMDGAKVSWFVDPDSSTTYGLPLISGELTQHNPDIVILHIGTNDINASAPLGDAGADGTVIYYLNQLVTAIVDHPGVDKLLLCQIIPKLDTPANQNGSLVYNNAIKALVEDMPTADQEKIELVNLYPAFLANQSTYFNLSIDPVHPNMNGYTTMADFFYTYIKLHFIEEITDEFNRAAGPTVGNNWTSDVGMQINDVGETGGGALTFRTAGDLNWDNLAVWETSRNLTTVLAKFHVNSTAGGIENVGLAVGLNSTNITQADGYLVVARGGTVNVKEIINGNANAGADISWGQIGFTAPQPGDILQVGYQDGTTQNTFSITLLRNGAEIDQVNISDNSQYQGNADTLYSGLLFHGYQTTPWEYYIDSYTVQVQKDDATPPDPVVISSGLVSKTSVQINWIASGDDGNVGTASQYDLRYSTSHITTEAQFAGAIVVPGLPRPKAYGSAESHSVTGLFPGTTYFMAMKVIDEWGNVSILSNEVGVTTNAAGFVHDKFDRDPEPSGSIGPNWNIDVNEYSIDYNAGPLDGEFYNTQGSFAWGRVSVYTGLRNPSVVRFVYGENTTEAGVGGTAMAVMLKGDDINTTDGYMMFIQNTTWAGPLLSLYEVRNGMVVGPPDGRIAEVPYTYSVGSNIHFPQDGDTLTVFMDWYDANGVKFNIQINGHPCTDGPIYDDNRLSFGINETTYAGLMLKRLFGTGNENAVDDFYAAAELSGVGGIEIVEGDGESATVSTDMGASGDSLRILVRDVNGAPLPDWPVWFWVDSPADATIDAPDPMFDPIQIEAEWDPEPEGSYYTVDNVPSASGSAYMVTNTGSSGLDGSTLDYDFYVQTAGSYWFWGRVITKSNAYALYITVDEGTANEKVFQWNTTYYSGSFSSPLFTWSPVKHLGSQFQPITFSKGLHSIKVQKAHDGLPIDKFYLTTSSSTPSDIMPYDVLMTFGEEKGENAGTRATALTLGELAGPNVVKARPFGMAETATITVTGLADEPVTVEVENQVQSGPARTILSNPFKLTLSDQFDNLSPGWIVNFNIISGPGSLTADSDTTDINGVALTYLTLGYGDTTQVQATVSGTSLDPIIFTGIPTSGNPAQIVSLVNTGGVKHYINDEFPDLLKVKILDDLGLAMADVPVEYVITTGNATVGTKQPNLSNALGIFADTLKLGSQAGVVTVEAYAGGLEETILLDSVYNHATTIVRAGPDTIMADIEEGLSRTKIQVRAWNTYPVTPAANLAIQFVVDETKGEGFHFPSAGDSITINTNANGYAETHIVPGPVHGKFTDIVQVRASDGFNSIQGSPVKFSITSESDASDLLYISGNYQEGVIEEELPLGLKVRMVDISLSDTTPIPNQPVIFKIESGDGVFSETDFPEVRILTDEQGYAEVDFTLGATAGTPGNPYNNVIAARATNGWASLGGSPVRFYLSARSSDAALITAVPVNDTLKVGTVGKLLSQNVKVKLWDSAGNPAIDEEVFFSIIGGSGTLGGTSDTTRSVIVDNAGGYAEMAWTLGPHAGTNINILEVRSSNGTAELTGSPLHFYATSLPDSVSPIKSIVAADGPTQADGLDTCWIEVTLKDRWENPVPGKRIRLNVVGGDDNHPYNPFDLTDANGTAIGYMVSYTAGWKQIYARVDETVDPDIQISQPAEVLFTATDAAEMRKYTLGSLSGNAGTVLNDSLAVIITDGNGNPVPYGPVRFRVVSGGGQIIGDETVHSDSSGIAATYVILGPTPGENIYDASANAQDATALFGSPVTFSVVGEEGVPVSMYAASAQVLNGVAGQVLDMPFKIGVMDDDGDPVAGVQIRYEIQQGGGSLETGQPVQTNAYGEAVTYYRADTQAGRENQILAENDGLAGGPILFTVTSQAGLASQLVLNSGNEQAAGVGHNVSNPLKVEVTDWYDNPVGGINIQYSVASGDAHFSNGETTFNDLTAGNGLAEASVQFGESSGIVKIHATRKLLDGSPVIFTLYSLSDEPATLKRYPESTDDIVATKGSILPEPLHVRVEDGYGNPVPGRDVVWAVSTGDAVFLNSAPTRSNEHGVASANLTAGQGNSSTVKALLLDKEVLFTIQQVNNPNFPQLGTITPDDTSCFELDELRIPIHALPDGDGDLITFELGDLFPPEGIEVKKHSSITATIQWTPNQNQQGVYMLHYQVIDGRGGFDADSIQVTVFDTNRKPVIQETYPESDTLIVSGQIMPFWVDVYDADNDPIDYTWRVDGQIVGENKSLFHLDIDKYFTGDQIIDVAVSDGKEIVRHRWNMSVFSSVELTEMIAQFDQWNNAVTLFWATSRETDNLGFEVFRATSKDGSFEPITQKLIPSDAGGEYNFTDENVQVGVVYYYKIIDVDVRENYNENGPIVIQIPKPDKFVLTQNYPNPFNPVTKIRYHVPRMERVSIVIYNMLGQKVATLFDKEHEPGYFVLEWNGRNSWGNEVSTGLYLYQLRSETKTLTKRMIKLK
ncbi:Ig-like domain-containing protein [candidate division KSB1 bacterium]|nr:Ig-like domain-containing protein [candidate division KSB1 bacterium]